METKPNVWINQQILPWEKAQIPILSHGLSRGSAIFEAFGIHEGADGDFTFRMDMHLKRLEKTAELLGMQLKYSSQEIADGVAALASEINPGRSLVKVMAYWSEEAIIDLILDSKLDVSIFIIPASKELSLDKVNPLTMCFSKWSKLHPETVPVEAKACANYLSGFLIRKDANNKGFDLGLALGTDGNVTEGSIESIFIVKDKILKTPPTGTILKSVSRDSILKLARDAGMAVEETNLQKEDIYSADEIFTCHTGIKVLPIKQFEDRKLDVPGPITARMMKMMDDVLNFRNDQYADWFQRLTNR